MCAGRGSARASATTSLLLLVLAGPAGAQQQSSREALRAAVLATVTAALPFPAAADDSTPLDGSPDPRWLRQVTADADGASRLVTFVANPLNEDVQAQAVRDMRDIQRSVEAAEARARGEFADRTSAAAQEERERPMLGISLDDEGVAGARADWRAQLTVDILTHNEAVVSAIEGREAPKIETSPRHTLRVAEGEHEVATEQGPVRRFAPEELRIYLGDLTPPAVVALADDSRAIRLEVPSGKTVVEIRARGNANLIQQLTERANWSDIEALLSRRP